MVGSARLEEIDGRGPNGRDEREELHRFPRRRGTPGSAASCFGRRHSLRERRPRELEPGARNARPLDTEDLLLGAGCETLSAFDVRHCGARWLQSTGGCTTNVGLAGDSSVPEKKPELSCGERSGRKPLRKEHSLMPFTSFGLHPDLMRGVKEMGFTRPDADPAGHDSSRDGRARRACLRHDGQRQDRRVRPADPSSHHGQEARRHAGADRHTHARARGADRGARQSACRPHAAVAAASVFGGVGMVPQEHAFRTGVDVLVATPGRLLDHFRFPYARLDGLEILVLDEADRMLDMGFLPDIRRILKHLPGKRQTLFFSATMPPPIMTLTREMLKNPFTVNLERAAAPAVGITQAVYPVAQNLKAPLMLELLKRGDIKNVLVVHPHEAPREPPGREPGEARRVVRADPRQPYPGSAHGRARGFQGRGAFASSSRRTSPPAASTSRRSPTSSTSTSPRPGRLHPPRRPHRPRGDDRRRVHVRLARGGDGPRADRARDRQAPAAR